VAGGVQGRGGGGRHEDEEQDDSCHEVRAGPGVVVEGVGLDEGRSYPA